jgi:hypothetical protein
MDFATGKIQCLNPPRMAGMEAGINNFLGFSSQNPKLKNGMDAIFEQRKG